MDTIPEPKLFLKPNSKLHTINFNFQPAQNHPINKISQPLQKFPAPEQQNHAKLIVYLFINIEKKNNKNEDRQFNENQMLIRRSLAALLEFASVRLHP